MWLVPSMVREASTHGLPGSHSCPYLPPLPSPPPQPWPPEFPCPLNALCGGGAPCLSVFASLLRLPFSNSRASDSPGLSGCGPEVPVWGVLGLGHFVRPFDWHLGTLTLVQCFSGCVSEGILDKVSA